MLPLELDLDYIVEFSGRADSGLMAGSYRITKDGRTASKECYFTHGTEVQAQYLTLITALSALIVTIEKNNADPFNFIIEVRGILPEPLEDEKAVKLQERAVGMLRRFGRYLIVDETAVFEV
jgi:hypothetical protein